MKNIHSLSRFPVVLLTSLFVATIALPWAHAAEPVSPTLQALFDERIATFEELVALTKAQFEDGLVTQDQVVAASIELARAKLERASTRAERIELLEEILKYLRTIEKSAQLQEEMGTILPTDKASARVARIDAEIQLVREREK